MSEQDPENQVAPSHYGSYAERLVRDNSRDYLLEPDDAYAEPDLGYQEADRLEEEAESRFGGGAGYAAADQDQDYIRTKPEESNGQFRGQYRQASQFAAQQYAPQGQAATTPVPPGAIKIGLWGSPQSGKTTYLAALRHAVGIEDSDYGRWSVTALTPESGTLMIGLTSALNRGEFPEGTKPGTVTPLQWMFTGDVTKSKFVKGGKRMLRALTGGQRVRSEFVLDLIDVSGLAFSDDAEADARQRDVANQALEHMLEAKGLIYLFDPLRERKYGDALAYVNKTIVDLKRKRYERTGMGGPLPHQLSVCVTKFDHADVFQEARRNGFVYDGPDGIPRVLDEHAKQFFEVLCTGNFWSKRYEQGDRSATFVMNELQASFEPGNIHYFVSSSIGFYKQPGWHQRAAAGFDPADFSNYRTLATDAGDSNVGGIRGPIHPINVLEPLISLQQRIAGRA